MSEPPASKNNRKRNPWLEPRTVEDETNRDILSAVFAIVIAKPETVSGYSKGPINRISLDPEETPDEDM